MQTYKIITITRVKADSISNAYGAANQIVETLEETLDAALDFEFESALTLDVQLEEIFPEK